MAAPFVPLFLLLNLGWQCVEHLPQPPASDPPLPNAYGPVSTLCDAYIGSAGGEEGVVPLARLHTEVRLFGANLGWEDADRAFAEALGGADWSPDEALAAYAERLGACVVEAADGELDPFSVLNEDGVVWVRPGLDPPRALSLFSTTQAVVLDLRGLPAGPDTADAITAALELVLVGDVELGHWKQRVFKGFPGSITDGGIYSSRITRHKWTVAGRRQSAPPLFVATDGRQAPEVARAAGALRLSGQAWLLGHDVWAQVAESEWSPMGDQGLYWTGRRLEWDDTPWPDRVPADEVTSDVEEDLAAWLEAGAPTAVAGAEPTRPLLEGFVSEAQDRHSTLDRGAARAMLMTAFGLVDRFYPYFEVVGGAYLGAVEDELAAVDALEEGDRAGVKAALGRLMRSLQDGHGFYGDWVEGRPSGQLALQIEAIGGVPVVRASGHAEVLPGDTILFIDDVSAEQWYADTLQLVSGATEGYAFDMATREWLAVNGTRELIVSGVDGVRRAVSLIGMAWEDAAVAVPWGGSFRPSGWLDELGGEGLYLLNLNSEVTTSDAQWEAALEAAAGATGLVVDMRDYPLVNHYSLAAALWSGEFVSPTFGVPVWTGPDALEWWESVYEMHGTGAYPGPVVLLVGPKTVSAAENFSMMLVDRPDLTVVGQRSAGTNGNITAGYLPGGYYLYFTGMEVLFPDGQGLHGVGIVPDVWVEPTAEDFAAGLDPELLAAIAVLEG